ncbi:type IX secretion system membrane protein PorP/SprF [Mesonia sp.]|uniref:PorP/SprF family type IX secretion system membrane protein n=1 Tax=Mesonia sp. TaxID=1960830 RepID=UPI0017789843|nr:type IX secretion system membrane protein PorP/SprF [Mesonia sp.]HIB38337.1 type IX secretion system membrane protein PorP/SprF [Mesonia sp.]HIO26273.1 type IX secretion system membrane protein PorP/SprF [Flavobacteriaceae bacterium]
MHRKIIKTILFVLFAISCKTIFAQQDAQYTQYMYNTLSVNPAYAGSRDMLSAVLLYRSQWVGVDGAPKTQTLSGHTPLNEKVGVGLNIVNDQIGPAKETYFDANFSYSLEVFDEAKLNFGLKAGAHLLDVDYSKLNIFDETDNNFQPNNVDKKISPQVGLGVMLYSENFYVGLSAPNILETKHFDESENASESVAKERIGYYLMSGYVFEMSNDVKFKPAILTKLVTGTPLQVDISANFLFYDKFTLGAAYRWSSAVSGLAGFQITDSLMVGVAYDADTTEFSEYSGGSFEAFLRFDLFKSYNKMVTPRFF